ncbi:GDSL-type esterase/lipase family protein [Aquiflexum lacus]|uniref:GDSL-type esterase/lipase family protein n=1 Tax=Aquiflexum lacus TaxID=2483805 RepID=UPI001896126E|nr:GDSL-type esterase/lipase family protein [Aquiflexum lacus]
MKKLLLAPFLFLFLISLAFAQDKIKVACVGNSITQGPGREHPESYPLQLQEILGDTHEVKNFGVSGRTLLKKGDYPYWNEAQFGEVKEFQPDVLIIKLGTNDSKSQNWKYQDEFVQDYIELIDTFKKSMPKKGKVYICIPVPVFKTNYGITEDILVNEMRPMLLEIAKKTKSQIINLYDPLLGHSDLLPDGIHPNTQGLAIMATEVARVIK